MSEVMHKDYYLNCLVLTWVEYLMSIVNELNAIDACETVRLHLSVNHLLLLLRVLGLLNNIHTLGTVVVVVVLFHQLFDAMNVGSSHYYTEDRMQLTNGKSHH